MGATVFYLLMLQNISIQSKRLWNKEKHPSCLRNISEDFAANNMKKKNPGFNGCVYDFSVDTK